MRAPASPQLRFLLRGSATFIVLLALWWMVLLSPMLAGLRFSTRAVLWVLPGGRSASGVLLEPSGDWMLRIPIPEFVATQDSVQRAYGRTPGAPPLKVRAFKLEIAERVPTFFMLGFPLFWALVLAAGRTRQWWRVAATGTALLALLAQLSLLLYSACSFVTTLRLATTGAAAVFWNAAGYLNVNVVPYLAPMVIAPWLHPGLRAQLFSWVETPEPVAVPVEPGKPRRGRYRGK